MKIITISREFGSGGRELGKRMADILHFAYYDKEIVSAIAKNNKLDEAYVSDVLDCGQSHTLPITIGRTFAYSAFEQQNTTKILVAQQRIVKELAAQGDCIIMWQSADVILHEHHPLNLFVYAEMSSKLNRCREQAAKDECFSDSELQRKIKHVDAGRSRQRELLTNAKWGIKENYHLCINTTDIQIKSLAPLIADYAKYRLRIDTK